MLPCSTTAIKMPPHPNKCTVGPHTLSTNGGQAFPNTKAGSGTQETKGSKQACPISQTHPATRLLYRYKYCTPLPCNAGKEASKKRPKLGRGPTCEKHHTQHTNKALVQHQRLTFAGTTTDLTLHGSSNTGCETFSQAGAGTLHGPKPQNRRDTLPQGVPTAPTLSRTKLCSCQTQLRKPTTCKCK